MEPDNDFLDACDIDFAEHASDDDLNMIALFAEALDPNNPKTVEEVQAEWEALFG